MRWRRSLLTALACGASLTSISCVRVGTPGDSLDTRTVTLPDGFAEAAEVEVTPEEMAKGMMYRDSLAAGHGMLFVQSTPGKSAYWMGHCFIPLDMIWMDSGRRVLEISADTPPCPKGDPAICPSFGGHFDSQYVLEIGGGEAARHNVSVGSTLAF